jgi:hypothetical protein
MSNLDNQPDPSRTEVQKGNAQAEVMRKLIQSKFPRTYRLLNGIRFQLPARRQADYPNHEYAAYWDGQLLMDGLTASRLNLLGDPTRWKPIAGAFLVTNEWLKLASSHPCQSPRFAPLLVVSNVDGFDAPFAIAIENVIYDNGNSERSTPAATAT